MKGGNECCVKENNVLLWDAAPALGSVGLSHAFPCPTEPSGNTVELNIPQKWDQLPPQEQRLGGAGQIPSPSQEFSTASSPRGAAKGPGWVCSLCCKHLSCFASQRKPRVQCDAVIAEVIKCILLSRFPKAVLTQRQLLFPHNISILLMNMHIRPINAPANPEKGRKAGRQTAHGPCCLFWGEGELRRDKCHEEQPSRGLGCSANTDKASNVPSPASSELFHKILM